MRSPRPSSLLAGPLVVQPYGFWHRPWARVGVLAIGLALGVLAASWLLVPGADGPHAENTALKAEIETVRRELDAERLRTAELRREAEIVAREAQRLRDELSQQRSAAKRRERAPSANEASAVPPPATSAVVPVAEAPPSAPRAE